MDSTYLEALFEAVREAPTETSDCVCVVAVENICFTHDAVYFGCGHWFDWRETSVWFHTAKDTHDIWCPKCLIGEVRMGRATLDSDGLKEVITAVNRFYGAEVSADDLPF